MMTANCQPLMRYIRAAALVLALAGGLLPSASAQDYPARPVQLIVPFAAGGPNDISARIIAEALSASLHQPVIVDNRPGAGGNIGAEATAHAPPDGYTLFWAQAATHGINPSLYRRLGYDAVADFAPVALVVSEPLVLVTAADSRWVDVQDLIAAAKAEPGAIRFGSGGIGTTPHLAAEMFALRAGMSLVHVPYRGNAPAVTDTIAGRVHLVFDGINAALGPIRAGRLKALAVTSRDRSPALPDVPSLAEVETFAGDDVRSWGGVAAPAGTPADVIARLSRELIAIGGRADIRQRFAGLGATLAVSDPASMDRFVRDEIARWREVIAVSGIAALD
ncbi:Bug family tripartite tricarboxylate transporter substrate binding protein [Inquilinus sp. CA228]|uniref:Bug family tripartite tricarboxylate transporter substrate binding protein n=1 Tax=Inquilinus sp. CA228 TaxID=3455609 RepID=UPI003F8D5E3C